MADYVKMTGAHLEHGFLAIELRRELPEEIKPRRIAVVSGGELQATEQKQAA